MSKTFMYNSYPNSSINKILKIARQLSKAGPFSHKRAYFPVPIRNTETQPNVFLKLIAII